MEKLKDGFLSRSLEKSRAQLNAAFANAKRLHPNLDAEDFGLHLIEQVDPIVNAVGAINPDRVDEVTHALYKVSLDLYVENCLGYFSRYPLINTAWRELF